MANPRRFTLSRLATMGWLRSRAPSALKTRAPLKRVSAVGFDSSSLIARTWEFGDGLKSSTLARRVCDPGAVDSVWWEKATSS